MTYSPDPIDPADESTHCIPSNALLFLTFYHFAYTTDSPMSTAPMQLSLTIMQSPSTIPHTHRTIGLVPHRRPSI